MIQTFTRILKDWEWKGACCNSVSIKLAKYLSRVGITQISNKYQVLTVKSLGSISSVFSSPVFDPPKK